ncbi:MAG TPA: TlpA disulfide reductase family protein [Acidobacteriaceae bacterium]|nr:TlpA disulfide reductase family protein [Acidobacteriaceae bacterium]
MNWAHRGNYSAAISSLKKAEKQDGGHCKECAYKIIDYGLKLDDFKAADAAAQDLISAAQTPKEVAEAHLERATVQLREAVEKNKMDCFAEADREFEATLAAWSNVPTACFYDGVSLAHLNRDADAKARFAQYLEIAPKDAADRERAERFIENIDLARARLAPAFAITTLDGRQVSLDRLAGKVVLIDFWATWCGPCRVSLPKIRDIAEKFSDEPLVVLSISLDSNEAKWKDFVAENHMSWPQYRDGGFDGPVSRLFSVNSIPHTFTIDADGILQEEHVGSHADFQGRLKKLLARAHQRQEALQVAPKPRS